MEIELEVFQVVDQSNENDKTVKKKNRSKRSKYKKEKNVLTDASICVVNNDGEDHDADIITNDLEMPSTSGHHALSSRRSINKTKTTIWSRSRRTLRECLITLCTKFSVWRRQRRYKAKTPKHAEFCRKYSNYGK